MCQIVVTGIRDLTLVAKSQLEFQADDKIGERLRLERKKIGLNQTDLASIGGVSLNTQHRYEAGGLPSTEYLLRIGDAGADWFWVLTGRRIPDDTLDSEQADLIRIFASLPPKVRLAMIEHMRSISDALDIANDRPSNATQPAITIHDVKPEYRSASNLK